MVLRAGPNSGWHRNRLVHQLSEAERREREDWTFEVALLMRNRFLAHEVYEEWFEGRITRKQWQKVVEHSRGMADFRSVMFERLIPNLEAIGLFFDRIIPHYEAAGLAQFRGGKAADELSGPQMLAELDAA